MREKVTSWKTAFKRRSNQFMVAVGSLPISWMAMPDDWRRTVAEWQDGALLLIATGLSGAAFFFSNMKQPKLEEEMRKAYAPDETDSQSDSV